MKILTRKRDLRQALTDQKQIITQDWVYNLICNVFIHVGAGLVILQGQVYLSAEEVDSPVHNVYGTSYHMTKHMKLVTNQFLQKILPYGKTCETSYKLVPAEDNQF